MEIGKNIQIPAIQPALTMYGTNMHPLSPLSQTALWYLVPRGKIKTHESSWLTLFGNPLT